MNIPNPVIVRKVVGPVQRVLRTIQQTIPAAIVSIGAVEAVLPSDDWTPTTMLVVASAMTAGLTAIISAAQNAWEGKDGVDTPLLGKTIDPPTAVIVDETPPTPNDL